MSVKASNWAWEQKLAPSAKLTLLALADAADERGECWPRLKTIATMSGTSERTVQRALKEFEAARLLEVTPTVHGKRPTDIEWLPSRAEYPPRQIVTLPFELSGRG